jgi:hypothetical protein
MYEEFGCAPGLPVRVVGRLVPHGLLHKFEVDELPEAGEVTCEPDEW